tara:strand:- start:109 stop:387 length:279 start_codon:yes stop_codon:yes gene_type:complete
LDNKVESEKVILSRFAQRIADHGMSVAAVFFLEMTKYMSFIGSQMLIFFGPVITSFVRSDSYYQLAELLEDRNNIEYLLNEIENIEGKKVSV